MRALAVLLLMLTAAAVAGALEPVAMLTDARGAVEVRQGSSWVPLALFGMVAAGTELRVGSAAEATLSFVAGGSRARLKGPCRVRLEAQAAVPLEGNVAASRPSRQTGAALPVGVNLDRMAGLRRGELVLNCDRACLSTTPRLSWTSEGFQELEVQVEEVGTYQRMFKTLVPPTPAELVIPASAQLQPGKEYLVSFTGFRADGTRFPGNPQPLTMRILDSSSAARVKKLVGQAEQEFGSDNSDVSPLVVLLGHLIELSLDTPARELARRLVKLRPADATLRRIADQRESP